MLGGLTNKHDRRTSQEFERLIQKINVMSKSLDEAPKIKEVDGELVVTIGDKQYILEEKT